MLAAFGLDERIFSSNARACSTSNTTSGTCRAARGRYRHVHSRFLGRNAKRFHGVMFVVDARASGWRAHSST